MSIKPTITRWGLPIALLQTERCEFASHWHYDFEAAFVLHGGVSVSVNGVAARLSAGDTFVCSNGDIHSYFAPSADSQVLLLTFDPYAARKTGTLVMDSTVRSSIFNKTQSTPDGMLDAVLRRMHAEYQRLSEASAFFLFAYILEIQGILHRYYQKREFQPGGAGRRLHLHAIRESINYIEQHFAESITIAAMAKGALMSVSSYSREFKKITGTGFKDYVNLVRPARGYRRDGRGQGGRRPHRVRLRLWERAHVQPRVFNPFRHAARHVCRAPCAAAQADR